MKVLLSWGPQPRKGEGERFANLGVVFLHPLVDIHRLVKISPVNASKTVGIIVVAAVFCAWTYITLTGEPRLQTSIANGSYSNDCCGTIILKNGTMTVANQRVSYVVEQDKEGPYVLPKSYVGASGQEFVTRSDAHALKLRLDDPTRPRKVQLLDDTAGGRAYVFSRMNGG
ncbi:hypothetical protein M9979_06565 [Sphingomonas sp. RP10(2022)]|uniref:Uncharacterized protein n=1 Tax=Sphingomonas liriopis TaxID=2949094 RepID=A0A9X2HNR2_9SPHN|nr:hypothetical protein [Sphingomonas liriopis]MCP3734536.1 hypothetical protein [Sphingomonas liriopis]